MMRRFLPILLAATAVATPALAQAQMTGISTTNAAGQTTTVFSVAPQTRVAAADYVKLTADALKYRIAADTLAISRAQRDDVKGYARASKAAAEREQGALFAALSNKDRKIAKPSTRLSSARQSSLDLLKKAPRASFDTLYLSQTADAAPAIWALQKGYATDGSDPVLRQVAELAVPSIERNYNSARGLTPAAVVAN